MSRWSLPSHIDEPATRREYSLFSTTTFNLPQLVSTKLMTPTHARAGHSSVNSRLNRFGADGCQRSRIIDPLCGQYS